MRIVQITTDSREHFKEYSRPYPYFGTAPEALLEGFQMLANIEVHIISCIRQAVKSPKKVAENIYFHSLFVPKIGWMSSGYYGCSRAIRSLCAKIKPDIVHGQGTERDCALAAVLSGFPNIVTLHGNMRVHARRPEHHRSIYHKMAAILETFCLKRTNGVVAISNYTEQLVKGLASKTWLLPNAVDSRFFDIILTPPCARPRFLFVGSLDKRKNPLGLLKACAPFLKANRCTLALAGQFDPMGEYGMAFQSEADVLPNIEYLGFLGRDKLAAEFAKSSVIILPTFEDNCPMVVLEAMAAGLPVAASRVGGVPDLVDHQITGLLFDPENLENMRNCIELLVRDSEFRISAGQAGKRKALEEFHPSRIAKRHIEIYQEILGKN
jgi:glycosyltransferase involved in cell wall biosynthesis